MRLHALAVAILLTGLSSSSSLVPSLHAQDSQVASSGAGVRVGAGESATAGQTPSIMAAEETEARSVAMQARNSRMGPVGGVHVVDAGSGPAASFRISLLGQLMIKDNLLLVNDSNRFGGGVLSLGVTPTSWLELSAALSARSLSNTGNAESPGLLQTFGNVFVDVKGFYALKPGLTLGGDVGVWFLGGVGEAGKDFDATSAQLRLNLSLDLRALTERSLPMLLRANLAYKFDNSVRTMEDVEANRLANIEAGGDLQDVEFRHLATRVERFALGMNRVDMATLSLGGEWPLATKKALVAPLLEWTWGIPINRQGYVCPYPRGDDGNKLAGVDSCLDQEGVDTWPSTLTAGVSVEPARLSGLSLLAALDVGLSGTRTFVQELAPNAPYMLYLGASYAVDARGRERIKEVEKVVEVKVEPPKGRVLGRVLERGEQTAVADARVHFAATDHTDLWAGDDGRFTSYPFSPGTEVIVELSAEGYEPASCSATIGDEASDVALTCEMRALPRVGSVVGLVIDGVGSPLEAVDVRLEGPQSRTLTTSAAGHFEATDLPPGEYTMRIEHEGYLIKVQPVTIEVREQSSLRIQLLPKPKSALVRINKDRIVLRNNVYFATDTAEIEPRSEPLLEELADLLIRTPDILRVEVQGHTDDTGEPAYNVQLSQRRAEAVRAWLVEHGVSADRLIAKGFGAEQAVAPNITKANRARNRRVELHIVEQLDATATPRAPLAQPAQASDPAP